ncbi:uncharacterized protein LOC124172877 isoform X2 [Ischnura elegans]|uniref:uncharacterized protein LOC124172877 isoform X2 n=1 Tax=Ischnura elegans TaxID=197161 RepID=UPI001ED8B01F|nr:uncharacterized protein LOC124172877 isoform X2 [Ischnura elegans]XP_046408338.1 uncharacterized protein LOC124172877 isoform X2 [Ischnura elegans]
MTNIYPIDVDADGEPFLSLEAEKEATSSVEKSATSEKESKASMEKSGTLEKEATASIEESWTMDESKKMVRTAVADGAAMISKGATRPRCEYSSLRKILLPITACSSFASYLS